MTYKVLEVEIPSILMAVIFIGTLIATIVGIMCKCLCVKKPEKPVPLVFMEMVDIGFPDLEKRKDSGYTVFGQEFNSNVFALLTIVIIPFITSTCFITFWNVYAVEEAGGRGCVENFDCFPKINGEYLLQEPVDNCSSFNFVQTDDSNSSSEAIITYDCYRLVFRYAEGFTAAGGILVVTAIISKMYFSILVSIRRVVYTKISGDCNKHCVCRFLLYGLVWSVMACILLLFLVINLGIPIVRRAVFRTVTDVIQFTMYTLNLILLSITGIIVAVGIEYP